MAEEKKRLVQIPNDAVSTTLNGPEITEPGHTVDLSRDQMNAFPFWFKKIKDIKSDILKIPRSVYVKVPEDVQIAFYMEDHDNDMQTITDFVNKTFMPAVREGNLGLVFIKNGCYSHKFDARAGCLPVMSDMPHAVLTVMYEAMLRCGFQYDGTECLVARERVPHDPANTPCIYNGLPFRPEYRVFYDFDKKRPIFTVDYWDRDYVRPNLHDLTDQLIYDAWYPWHIRDIFEKNAAMVQNAVAQAMDSVKGLEGPWSIDVMQDEKNQFWLIDMAVAEMSAYWERRPKDLWP